MKILFRLDAGVDTGLGHLMRCIVLASLWRALGADVVFYFQYLSGNAKKILVKRSFDFVIDDSFLWLEKTVLYDWVVIDGYDLDLNLEQKVKSNFLLVLEDWPHREHCCDILLDQNLGANSIEYEKYLLGDAKVLAGSQFLMIRDEFKREVDTSNLSVKSLDKNKTNVLINLGGEDKAGITSFILDELASHTDYEKLNLKIIVSEQSPSFNDIYSRHCGGNKALELIGFTDDIVSYFDWADISIGAGGSSVWEKALRGLPTAILVLADNQLAVSKLAVKNNIAISIGDFRTSTNINTNYFYDLVRNPERINRLSRSCKKLFDAKGGRRVISEMISIGEKQKILRPANKNDARYLYRLQCENGMRKYFHNKQTPIWREHYQWLTLKVSRKSDKKLYVINVGGLPAGQVRLDMLNNNVIEISISLSKKFRGLGLAALAIDQVFMKYPGKLFKAYIYPANKVSKKIFLKQGFQLKGRNTYYCRSGCSI
jgi:UDP-2,4-diacetamido-2,4,6-trideoxy-beta-L-altropyranose hydrolase